MIEAQKQRNLNKILTLIADLEARFTPDALELAFVHRAIDNELAEIGELQLGVKADPHIKVFTGYEIVKNSPYAAV